MSTADDRIETAADELFAAIERGDAEKVASMWAGDITVWHAGDVKDNDRARALRVIDWFITATTKRSYEILDRRIFDGGFVQQHVLRADGSNGASITLRVCIVIGVDADGLMNRIDEYFDPAEMAALF